MLSVSCVTSAAVEFPAGVQKRVGGIPGDGRESGTCMGWEAAGGAGSVCLSHPSASAHSPLSCTTPYKETPGSARFNAAHSRTQRHNMNTHAAALAMINSFVKKMLIQQHTASLY